VRKTAGDTNHSQELLLHGWQPSMKSLQLQ
jgi:hypothetical protein